MEQAILPIFPEPRIDLMHGDCLDVLRAFPDNSVDSVVTDPPYALEFMGKGWDKVLPSIEIWKECLRVAKPGAILLAFGGTRTYHRLTCAIEDAGWEIRDCLMYVYGSGFPKSTNISKQLGKMAGAERVPKLIPTKKGNLPEQAGDIALGATGMTDISEPISPQAQEWNGYGTALKPAYEPIVMAMKPKDGTFANNALKWGVSGINIDGCRVGTETIKTQGGDKFPGVYGKYAECQESTHKGRFPANFIHDGSEEVVSLFPDSKGQQGDVRGTEKSRTGGVGTNCHGEYDRIQTLKRNDSGSAARFFYCAKASNAERNDGCEGLPTVRKSHMQTKNGTGKRSMKEGFPDTFQQNNHPTVKPLKLMEYLCKLSMPPNGGTVLDPFLGSGTTGVACRNLNRDFIGIEKDPDYFKIAQARIQ